MNWWLDCASLLLRNSNGIYIDKKLATDSWLCIIADTDTDILIGIDIDVVFLFLKR